MPKENNKNEPELQFIIDEEYIASILESTFETEFTDDQWQEFFYDRIGTPIYEAVYDTIREILDFAKLAERNKNAETHHPHWLVKWKNPNAYVNEFKVIGCFKTETDAQKRIDYEQCITEYDEWKIEKVE